ncbi:MAG: hypothetical protein KDK36_18565, partial [Leptospiraceae bacterium]|nr:hypothetical protein [Leptospiraceae bacterium]
MKNKLRLILLLFIFTFLNFYCQSITPYPHNKRYLVAVLQIENKTDNHIPKDTLDSVQLQITNGLVSYKRIRLLERDRIDAILKEQKLSQLGIIDGNEAIKVGKLLGADAVLIGEISGIKKDFNEIEAPLTKNTFL